MPIGNSVSFRVNAAPGKIDIAETIKRFNKQACTSTSPGIHATASIRPSTTGTPNGASRKATSGYSAYGYANSTQTQQPTSTTNTNYSPYMSEFSIFQIVDFPNR
ncbi:hypothetical protein L3Y34_001655 [Caenorhabditis briggsae]|uniref:Uncharacterized protein n=1 Tax=Caenorhabditis briggsae TaxID=6238 RepID=A0AAE9DDB9_CAEBR|nr:hypothetical protein L3Y34_001655 [Caenorhabditis briggsae]